MSHLSLPLPPPSCQYLFFFPGLFRNMSGMMEAWHFGGQKAASAALRGRSVLRAGVLFMKGFRVSGSILHWNKPHNFAVLEEKILFLPPPSPPPKSLCVAQNISFAFLMSSLFCTWTQNFKTSEMKRFPGSIMLFFKALRQEALAVSNPLLPPLLPPRILPPHHPDSIRLSQSGV